jgi:hypothetical protein
VGDLDRQRRLADAAHPVDGADDHRPARPRRGADEQGPQRGELVSPSDEVGDRAGKLPGNRRASSALTSCQLVRDPGQQPYGVLTLEMRQVVIELVGQGGQRSATHSSGKDLLDDTANQRLRNLLDGEAEGSCRRLPGAGQTGIAQHGELHADARLQCLQDRGLLLKRGGRHGLPEDLVQHRRQVLHVLVGSAWSKLAGRLRDCRHTGTAKCPLLFRTEQLLA